MKKLSLLEIIFLLRFCLNYQSVTFQKQQGSFLSQFADENNNSSFLSKVLNGEPIIPQNQNYIHTSHFSFNFSLTFTAVC